MFKSGVWGCGFTAGCWESPSQSSEEGGPSQDQSSQSCSSSETELSPKSQNGVPNWVVDFDTLRGLMLEVPKGLELAAGQMFLSVQMVRNWDGIPGGSVWPVAATTCLWGPGKSWSRCKTRSWVVLILYFLNFLFIFFLSCLAKPSWKPATAGLRMSKYDF